MLYELEEFFFFKSDMTWKNVPQLANSFASFIYLYKI